MTITSQDYAFLSNHVYGNVDPEQPPVTAPSGAEYNIIEVYNDASGYAGVIYQHSNTGELIVAHRGTQVTDDLVRDLVEADGQMLLVDLNQQIFGARHLVQRAQELSDGLGGVPVTVTGHSLGGALAQITAAQFGLYGETFNAYGAAGLYDTPEGGTQVVNHVRVTDIVAAAGTHFGEVRAYATVEDSNLLFIDPHLPTAQSFLDLLELLPPNTHDIADFYGEDSIITPENIARYENDQFMYDAYRGQIWGAAHAIPIAAPGLALLNPATMVGYAVLISYLYANYAEAASRAAFLGTNDIDSLTGKDTVDYMSGLAGADLFSGGLGDDVIKGGTGNDTLRGQGDDDSIEGNEHDDYLDGGSGSDRLDGGTGHDRYDFWISDFQATPGSVDTIVDTDGQGTIEINSVPLAIGERLSETTWLSLTGDFVITADLSQPSQTLKIKHIATGSTILVEAWANDTLGIQLGGDVPTESTTNLTTDQDLFGAIGTNPGDDAIAGLAGNDGLEGGAGADVLDGGNDADLIFGGSGDDTLLGGAGNDLIFDGSELTNQREWSTDDSEGQSEAQWAEQDILDRGASVVARGKSWYVYTADGAAATGNSTLDAGYVVSTPSGGADLDPNASPSGDDIIDGGAGSDIVYAGEGDDQVFGGENSDAVAEGNEQGNGSFAPGFSLRPGGRFSERRHRRRRSQPDARHGPERGNQDRQAPADQLSAESVAAAHI